MKKIRKSLEGAENFTSTTGTPKSLTMDDLKKSLEMLEANALASARFIPELWSKKLLDKFNESTFFPSPFDSIRELTAEIKRLSESGLTPEQIAEKIDPDKYFGEATWEFAPGKTWKFGKVDPLKKGEIGQISGFKIYGTKIIKPGGYGILGTSS